MPLPSNRTLFKALSLRPDAAPTLSLLKDLSQRTLNPQELLDFHEALLFYKAYPRSQAIYNFCCEELAGFYARVRSLDEDDRANLDQTGVVGSRIFYAYDDEMVRWLVKQQQGHVDIDWDEYEGKEEDPLSAQLPLFLSEVEQDAVDDPDVTTKQVVAAARGLGSSLEWVLDRFAATYPADLRAEVYNPMQIPLQMELIPEGPSRTLIDDGMPDKLYLWDPQQARAKFNLIKEIKRPLRLPKPLPQKLAAHYVNMALGTLLVRHRELFPLTHVNLKEVYDIRLDRGVRIIWWMMVPEWRLPLEVGWGCIILKNHVPIGYGAGGHLEQRTEISINVFDTFRGGEAAWLYAQYARICMALCPADWLVTRKWQLGGEGNEEGLLSGSYWFYDKLGFRSTEAALRKITDRERKRIAVQKGYRTPKSILRKIAEADIVLSLSGKPAAAYQEFPLSKIGALITNVIARDFAGRRKGLEARVLKEVQRRFGVSCAGFSKRERQRFAQMALLAFALPDFARRPRSEQRAFFDLCRRKGAEQEASYAHALPRCKKLFTDLQSIALKRAQ